MPIAIGLAVGFFTVGLSTGIIYQEHILPEIHKQKLDELLREGNVQEFNKLRKEVKDKLVFEKIKLSNAKLGGINLESVHLRDSEFIKTDFVGLDYAGIDFDSTRIQNFIYSMSKVNSNIKNPLFEVGLKKSTNLSNAYMPGTNLHASRFLVADLANINLENVDLSKVGMLAVNMSNSNLKNTNFTYSIILDSDLSHANMYNADLSFANFTLTDFTGANLTNANLSQTDLRYVKNLPISTDEAKEKGALID